MQIVGEQIRIARLRRNLSITQVRNVQLVRFLWSHAWRKAHRQWQSAFISGCPMRFSWMMISCCLQRKTRWERHCRIWVSRKGKGHPRRNRLWKDPMCLPVLIGLKKQWIKTSPRKGASQLLWTTQQKLSRLFCNLIFYYDICVTMTS